VGDRLHLRILFATEPTDEEEHATRLTQG